MDSAPFATEATVPATAVMLDGAHPMIDGPPTFLRPSARRMLPASTPAEARGLPAVDRPGRRDARIALAVGLASLLILPFILGPAAIVLGARSVRAGERRLGAWALSAGIAGTILATVGVILWATGVLPNLDELFKVG